MIHDVRMRETINRCARRPEVLLALAVAVVAGYWLASCCINTIIERPAASKAILRAQPNYAGANLAIDIIFEVDGSVSATGTKVVVTNAWLKCPHFQLLDLPFPARLKGWCGKTALNLPVDADTNESASLMFEVEPSPDALEVASTPTASPAGGPFPHVAIVFSGKEEIYYYSPERVRLDHWVVRVSKPSAFNENTSF